MGRNPVLSRVLGGLLMAAIAGLALLAAGCGGGGASGNGVASIATTAATASTTSAHAKAKDGWWREHLARAFRDIVARERLTKRHAAIRRAENAGRACLLGWLKAKG